MNTKKLDILASHAGFDVKRLREPYPGGFPREDMLALESFAELIVKECMRLSVIQSDASYVSNYIAKHFGVEK